MKTNQRKAFTLVELLVVIAIIGILVALLLPAVQAAREAARRMQCMNNLSQLALAVQNYEMSFNVYPPGTIEGKGPIVNEPIGYHQNWMSQILPYIEESTTYKHIDFGVGVYDDKNIDPRNVMISIFRCPSCASQSEEAAMSDYAGCHHDQEAPIDIDNNGVFFLNSKIRYEDISDGTTHTIFIGEKVVEGNGDLGWMSGTRATLRNMGEAVNNSLPGSNRGYGMEEEPEETAAEEADPKLIVGGFASRHPGGANFAFGDGSIHFVSQSLDTEAWQMLGNRADGKLVKDRY